MKASLENPVYTIYVVAGGSKYDLTPVAVSLVFTDQKKQLAQSLTATIMNVKVNGVWLSSLIKVRQRIFVYANDGEKNEEVYRGYIWTRGYKSSISDRELVLKCYDNLIYLQESDDSEYFSAGKSSSDVVNELCSKWGVQVKYNYESITHEKLALRGNLSDIIITDILNVVVDKTSKKYVIISEKDVMMIKGLGTNARVYNVKAKHDAIMTKSECTMDGMVTKVSVLSRKGTDERDFVEGTLSQNTGEYGTMQTIITREEDKTLDEVMAEAQGILDKKSTPTWEYEVEAVDIPWIRKGDKVYVNAGDIADQNLIVTNLTRNISAKGAKMTLTLEKP